MRRHPPVFGLLGALLMVCAAVPPAMAADAPQPGPFENIFVIDFEGEIGPLTRAYMERRIKEAKEKGADCIVLRVDSFGGRVDSSKAIGDMLLELPRTIHTVAWVPTKAISGAAFISVACREIIMAPSASIGDSQPILQGPDGKPQPVGEKIESPLRTWFRTYAEANGYPIPLVEAMVSASVDVIEVRPNDGSQRSFYLRGEDYREADDDAVLVPGFTKAELDQVGPAVVRKGELLTFTAQEALRHGFIKRTFDGGLPSNEEAVLAALKAPNATVTFTAFTFSESASRWLLQLAGILSALVALAVLFTMWQGPGLITLVGGVALLLIFMINATAEQLHGFPIFLMLLGVGLLLTELFLLPGFLIPGLLGVGSLVFGLLLLATGRAPDELGTLDSGVLLDFGLQFISTVLVAAGTFLALGRFLPRVGPARRMILTPSTPDGGPLPTVEAAPHAPSLGARGVARSALRPAGTAEIDGDLVDVVSAGTMIDAGQSIRVVAVEGATVTVEEVDA